MIFHGGKQQSRWIEEFYKAYGDLMTDLWTTVVTNVLNFTADPEMFQTLLNDFTTMANLSSSQSESSIDYPHFKLFVP